MTLLTLTVASGPSQGAERDLTRTVVAPTGAHLGQLGNEFHRKDYVSAQMKSLIYIEPANVSFSRIFFIEGVCPPDSATGLFGYLKDFPHPMGAMTPISRGDAKLGCCSQGIDTDGEVGVRYDAAVPPKLATFPAQDGFLAPPNDLYVGDFDWPIPWYWSADMEHYLGNFIRIAKAHMHSDNTGSLLLEKAELKLDPKPFADENSEF